MAKSGDDLTAREAKWGSRMIEVRLRFWTDNLAPKGEVIPKHAWSSGMARMMANEPHGIKSGKRIPFNSLPEIASTVEKVLIEHGVTLHPSNRMQRYLADAPKRKRKS